MLVALADLISKFLIRHKFEYKMTGEIFTFKLPLDEDFVDISMRKQNKGFAISAILSEDVVSEEYFTNASIIAFALNSTEMGKRTPGFVFLDMKENKLVFRLHCQYSGETIDVNDFDNLLTTAFEMILTYKFQIREFTPEYFLKDIGSSIELYNRVSEQVYRRINFNNRFGCEIKHSSYEKSKDNCLNLRGKFKRELSKLICEIYGRENCSLKEDKNNEKEYFSAKFKLKDSPCEYNLKMSLICDVQMYIDFEVDLLGIEYTKEQIEKIAVPINAIHQYTANGRFIVDSMTNKLFFKYSHPFFEETINQNLLKEIKTAIEATIGILEMFIPWVLPSEVEKDNFSRMIIVRLLRMKFEHALYNYEYQYHFFGDYDPLKIAFSHPDNKLKNSIAEIELWEANGNISLVLKHEYKVKNLDNISLLKVLRAVNLINIKAHDEQNTDCICGILNYDAKLEKFEYLYATDIKYRSMHMHNIKVLIENFLKRASSMIPLIEMLISDDFSFNNIEGILEKNILKHSENVVDYGFSNLKAMDAIDSMCRLLERLSFKYERKIENPESYTVLSELQLNGRIVSMSLKINSLTSWFHLKLGFVAPEDTIDEGIIHIVSKYGFEAVSFEDKLLGKIAQDNTNCYVGVFNYDYNSKQVVLNCDAPLKHEYFSEKFWDNFLKSAIEEIDYFYEI